MPQIKVTAQPAAEKLVRNVSMRVPVLEKKRMKTGICERNVIPAMSSTNSESMMRSVTTVPMALGNDTPS